MTRHVSEEALANLRRLAREGHAGAQANLDAALGRRPSAKENLGTNSNQRKDYTSDVARNPGAAIQTGELDRNPSGVDAGFRQRART
jgi:hypothetical protein